MYHTNEDFGLLLGSRKRTADADEEDDNARKKGRAVEGRGAGQDVPISPLPISPRFPFCFVLPTIHRYNIEEYYTQIHTHTHTHTHTHRPLHRAPAAKSGRAKEKRPKKRGLSNGGQTADEVMQDLDALLKLFRAATQIVTLNPKPS